MCDVNQRCCSQLSGLRLTREELEKYFENHAGGLAILKYKNTFIVSTKENGPCPYWKKSGCMIYHHRPIDCRLYPYEITGISERKKTIEVTFGINQGCPQKDRLLMPVDEAKAFIEVFCQAVYGQDKPIIIKYHQAAEGSPRIFQFFNMAIARISKLLRAHGTSR